MLGSVRHIRYLLLVTELTLVPILLLAAFVHGAFGFGFPIVSTPLLALAFPLPTAILMTLLPTVSINIASILGERHWREALRRYWSIPVFTIIGSFSGTQWLLHVDPEPFRALLALVLVAYLVSHRLSRHDDAPQLPGWTLPLLGFCLGLLAGLVNIFAPLLVVFALYSRMPPELMVATFNLSFLTSKSGQILGYVSNGAFDLEVVRTTAVLIPLVLLSLWLGMQVRKRFAMEQYKRVLRGFLWLASVWLIGDWLFGMLGSPGTL
jgi:uncharacterized membrane protein YfcA